MAQQVPEDRRRVRGRQRVPLAAPAEDEVARAGRRGRRPGRRCRRWAFAVSQRPFVWIRSRISPDGVGRAAGGPVALDREVAVRALAVRDPVGADHARVADVDHVRVADVQPDPEAGEEDRRRRRAARPARRRRRAGAGRAPDPDAAREQPDERRVDERHRREDVAVVEEPERDREREQHEQVEVAQREQPPPVDEAEQEHGAEAEPDRVAVDLLAAERARAAARHLPRDLRPRPRLEHRAVTSSTVPVAISPAVPDQTFTVHVPLSSTSRR